MPDWNSTRNMIQSLLTDLDLSDKQQLTLILLGVTGATYVIYRMLLKSPEQEYPPGPPTLPILGNVHQVAMCSGNFITFLEKNRKKYGNVYTIELGGVKRIVVSGFDVMQELLEKNADYSSNRTASAMPDNYGEVAKETPGLFWANYPHWKTIRSFALNQLRDEGMGKSSLEPKIMEEFHSYVDHFISPYLGQAVDLSESLSLATANIISLLLFGNRREYGDEEFVAWKKAVDLTIEADMKAAMCKNIPLVKYLPGDMTGKKTNKTIGKFVVDGSMGWVEEGKKTLDPDNPAGFLDNFLLHAKMLGEKGDNIGCFTDGNAAIACMQLYVAGLETTATALRWALLYMAVYPDIQDKVRSEIDQYIGQREVVYKDRLSMPYTEAVIQEVFRRSNIAPTALPHTLEKSLLIDGKLIPAGTELMLNMTSVLHDESMFEEPDLFKPERFLTGDIELKKSRNIPFGMGRRVCLGRDLAKMEFFLFFVSFLQRYDVTYSGDTPPSLEGVPFFINTVQQHRLIFTSK